MPKSHFASVAAQVMANLNRVAVEDRDAEWQRVNSYIADVLKDAHVLYAKLARLQGDFAGSELKVLEGISEDILSIGGKLSSFSKAFYEGKADMSEEESFGEGEGGDAFDLAPSEEIDFSGEEPKETPEKKSEGKGEGAEVDLDFDYSEEKEEKEEKELY